MNTFKTIVVMSTLMGLGYGAHVILNKSVAPLNESFATLDGWANPHVQLDHSQSPISAQPTFATQVTGVPETPTPPANPFSDPPSIQPSTSEPVAVWPTPETTAPAGPSPQASIAAEGSPVASLVPGSIDMPRTAGQQISYQSLPTAPPLQTNQPQDAASPTAYPKPAPFIGPAATSPAATESAEPNLPADPEFPATPSPGSPSPDITAGAADPLTPVHDSAFEDMWSSSQEKLRRDELTDALFTMSLWYNDPYLTSQQRDVVVPLLDQLAGTVIYSREHRLEAPHIVASGETLQQIADAYQITPEFMARVNGLDPTQPLAEGTELKVARGPFRAELSLSRREITVFLGRYYAGRFSVGIGRDFPAQSAAMHVFEKDGARPYADARTSQQVAAGAADNPYGHHWIGLQGPGSPQLTGIGIHGSGADIDASDTRGHVSMSERDADDLQVLLSVGSAFMVTE